MTEILNSFYRNCYMIKFYFTCPDNICIFGLKYKVRWVFLSELTYERQTKNETEGSDFSAEGE